MSAAALLAAGAVCGLSAGRGPKHAGSDCSELGVRAVGSVTARAGADSQLIPPELMVTSGAATFTQVFAPA